MKTKLSFIFLFLSTISFAQDFTNYPREDFYPAAQNIYTVYVDNNDLVYVGTSTQLFRFDGLQWDSLNISQGLPGSIKAITKGANDSIYFGVINNGIYSTFDLSTYNSNGYNIVNSWVNVLTTDSDGKIWIGTNSGLSVIDGINVTNYTNATGLLGYTVKTIEFSADGKAYIGTESGVSIYDGENWTYLTNTDGLVSNNVTAIDFDDNGRIWFGTYDQGISIYDGENWTVYNSDNTNTALFTNEIKDLLWDGDRMWVAGFYLSKFENSTWTKYTSLDDAPNFPNHLAKDSEGNIWISNLTGITMYGNSGNGINTNKNEDQLGNVYPNPVSETLFFSFPNQPYQITICNLLGSTIFSGYQEENMVDLSLIESGIYFLTITNRDGLVFTEKIVKE